MARGLSGGLQARFLKLNPSLAVVSDVVGTRNYNAPWVCVKTPGATTEATDSRRAFHPTPARSEAHPTAPFDPALV